MELRDKLTNLWKVTRQDGGEYRMMKGEFETFLESIEKAGGRGSKIAGTLLGLLPRFTWGFPEISQAQASVLAMAAEELGLDIPETRRMTMNAN